MQNGKRMVQEGALTALASVADSAQVRDINRPLHAVSAHRCVKLLHIVPFHI